MAIHLAQSGGQCSHKADGKERGFCNHKSELFFIDRNEFAVCFGNGGKELSQEPRKSRIIAAVKDAATIPCRRSPICVKISDAEHTNALRCRRTVSVCTLSPDSEIGIKDSTDFADFGEMIGDDHIIVTYCICVIECNLW